MTRDYTVTPAVREQRRQAATRHGAFAWSKLSEAVSETAVELEQLLPLRSEADKPAVWLLATTLERVRAIGEWLDEHGVVDEDGQPRPILDRLPSLLNAALKQMQALGLTPTARAALGFDVARAEAERLTVTRLAALADQEAAA